MNTLNYVQFTYIFIFFFTFFIFGGKFKFKLKRVFRAYDMHKKWSYSKSTTWFIKRYLHTPRNPLNALRLPRYFLATYYGPLSYVNTIHAYCFFLDPI